MSDGPVFTFYALNGTGGGHIARQTNIAREVRALLAALDVPHEILVLTTSDAPQIARGLFTYKLPSKTTVGPSQLHAYMVRSQTFVMNCVAAARPSVLVMDTAPEGSFNEFGLLRNLARSTAFVNRHRDEQQQADAAYQGLLAAYTRVLTPDDASEAERYVFSDEVRARNAFVGVIHGYREERALARDEVRAELDVQDGERLVYVSAGAGGDPEAERALEDILAALAGRPDVRILVGYGPLYRGRIRHRRNVVAYQDVDVSRYFAGVDAAISAAGYNTYHELLAAGVPAAFFAQAKKMDRQDERVALGVTRGWHLGLADTRPETVAAALDRLLDPATADSFRAILRTRGRAIGATKAAFVIAGLGLRAAGDPSSAAAATAKLPLAYACRLAWTDVCAELGIRDQDGARFTEAVRTVLFIQARRPHALEDDLLFVAGTLANDPGHREAAGKIRAALKAAVSLIRRREAAGAAPEDFTRALRLELSENPGLDGLDARVASRLAA